MTALQRLREKWVDVAKAKILQEQIAECYMRSSVNHLEECKPLVKQYFSLTRQPTFGIGKQGGAPYLPADEWTARFRS
jgi:NADH dehydrogenase (ubiquinone) 1 beta subcomplex subunit 10